MLVINFGAVNIDSERIVGASEKLAEIYAGPLIGSGIENWFPYVLAMLFLLVRPTGLFGERSIDRV